MLSKDAVVQQAAPFCEGFAEHVALVDLPGFGDWVNGSFSFIFNLRVNSIVNLMD